MSRSYRILLVVALLGSAVLACSAAFAQVSDYARDPHQAIDDSYTAAIRKYTTEPQFNSPLTDYLPASKTVPTPAKVLGDVSGAPEHAALRGGCLQILPPSRRRHAARARRHHWPHRRGPRDDRGRHRG